ncbi:dynamin family protein [Comamonas serinivorans]|uniref:Dynamin family protein n=2 Tax=Comamonas serinivorans TaxID=1082851 RepID=A0A1Y0ETS6_9BURK|nr:dynamin family protein [Comamonas serinivorans]
MQDHDLLDPAFDERLRDLELKAQADKVMVAFVAEFSRGKSELINAIFFAGYGRRIMPATAGRTTMCPTELGFEARLAPCLRLLPIETRLQPQPLSEWRLAPERWQHLDLDVGDPEQLAQTMARVADTIRVDLDQARALGFWSDDVPEDNLPVGADGRVEVPKWRHALINLDHPLLKAGLVILDTPGLNAIGAEPELTVSLIPQAQAVVFILAADAGVTRSDLAIWREHLAGTGAPGVATRYAVLNKIDTLWDGLSTPEQTQAQLDSQCAKTAELLQLQPAQVIAVSAQKALLAKVNGDERLLQDSRLPVLEDLLGQRLIGERQQVLMAAVQTGIAQLRQETERILAFRRRELAEQLLELKGLRGKNGTVVQQLRLRVEREQAEFDQSGARLNAVRSVHLRLLKDVFELLGNSALKREMAELNAKLRQPGIKFGLKAAYAGTFDRLRNVLLKVQALEDEIQTMLTTTFRQLNADYGFSLQVAPTPDMTRFVRDLDVVERTHLQYLGTSNLLRLVSPEFTDRLVRALHARVRSICETALAEMELWNKSASAQLDAQLRERRRHHRQRVEAIARIQQAASGLSERIEDLGEQDQLLDRLQEKLDVLIMPFQRGVRAGAQAVNG